MNLSKIKHAMLFLLLVVGVSIGLSGCSDADVASHNISQDADNFKVLRRITFINTVTNEELFTVEGNMSVTVDKDSNKLDITAKTGEDKFQKHLLGLSPTTVYIVEQLEWQEANQYNFKITLKPSTVIPEVDIR